MRRAAQRTHCDRSELQDLQEALLIKVGKGFNATAYTRNELFNHFCVNRGIKSQRLYDANLLDLAISALVDSSKLTDYGDNYFGIPRPKTTPSHDDSFQ